MKWPCRASQRRNVSDQHFLIGSCSGNDFWVAETLVEERHHPSRETIRIFVVLGSVQLSGGLQKRTFHYIPVFAVINNIPEMTGHSLPPALVFGGSA